MNAPANICKIGPQPGPQEAFLASPADIAIYGGGAGGGKTWALLIEAIRHHENPGFGAVFFRRTTVQIRNEGGLWDESTNLYPAIGGVPSEHVLTWKFPKGSAITFAHLEHDKTVNGWQGSQVPLICFDELCHFSAKQFWYMVSRNRSMCGVKPYIRATCNPDPDSWVATFIAWWINQETGFPIPERAGQLRWFVRVGDELKWADTPQELDHFKQPNDAGEMQPIPPKSVTFIPAKLTDNPALMKADPGYMASLMSLPEIERERLLGGNWKIQNTEARVFHGKAHVEAFDPGEKWDGPYYGGDFGFSQDPTAAVEVWINGDDVCIRREAFSAGLELDDTAAFVMGAIPGFEQQISRWDNARPESISHLKRHGLPLARSVEKWPGSIEDGIAFLRSFKRIVIHPDCVNMQREARLYSYKVNDAGDPTTKIVDAHNHGWDAVRYAVAPLVRRKEFVFEC